MSASMFPARAGMSRTSSGRYQAAADVPRASGDEPGATVYRKGGVRCSPRERG